MKMGERFMKAPRVVDIDYRKTETKNTLSSNIFLRLVLKGRAQGQVFASSFLVGSNYKYLIKFDQYRELIAFN